MKRILITGANKGIGLATVAKLLGSYDETFLLLGSRDSKKGQQALNSLLDIQPEWKDRLDLIQIDVEQDLSVNSAAEEVVPSKLRKGGSYQRVKWHWARLEWLRI
mgnify:CR=1 FL=1